MSTNPITALIQAEVKETSNHKGKPYICPWDSAKVLLAHIEEDLHNFPDAFEPYGSALIETMIGVRMFSHKDWLYEWCTKAREHMRAYRKDHKATDGDYVGDADTWLYMLVDDEKKTVFHVHDSPSCADIVDWIVVWDRDGMYDEVHIREVLGKGKKSKWGQAQPMKFWKDRAFSMEYEEERHMTDLGGVYGDTRDPGYVFSVKKYSEEMVKHYSNPDILKRMGEKGYTAEELLTVSNDHEESHFYFYWKWKHVMRNLRWLTMLWRTPENKPAE